MKRIKPRPTVIVQCRHCKQDTNRIARICNDCLRRHRIHNHQLEESLFDDYNAVVRALTPDELTRVQRYIDTNTQDWFDIDSAWGQMLVRCKKYKLGIDRWLVMVATTNAHCAICDRYFHPLTLNIDHDHHSGAVRGLLCTSCNTGLGLLGIDGPEADQRMVSVFRYLTLARLKNSGQPKSDTRRR